MNTRPAARAAALTLALAALTACGLFQPPPPPGPTPVDFWTYQPFTKDATARAKLFAFQGRNPLRQLYLESGDLLDSDPDGLAAFIAEAHAHGIKVMLMAGDSTWVHPDRQHIALEVAAKAVAFTQALERAGQPAPTGIQFDIEPHALPEWGDDAETLMAQYATLLERLRTATRGQIRLAHALPFWYDGLVVERGGKPRILSEFAQDQSDLVVLMDYRDRLDLAIAAAQNEVDYARRTGKKVVIGAESQCFADLSLNVITYCEEGREVLDTNLRYINQAFSGTGALDGVAVFSLEHYQAMKD